MIRRLMIPASVAVCDRPYELGALCERNCPLQSVANAWASSLRWAAKWDSMDSRCQVRGSCSGPMPTTPSHGRIEAVPPKAGGQQERDRGHYNRPDNVIVITSFPRHCDRTIEDLNAVAAYAGHLAPRLRALLAAESR